MTLAQLTFTMPDSCEECLLALLEDEHAENIFCLPLGKHGKLSDKMKECPLTELEKEPCPGCGADCTHDDPCLCSTLARRANRVHNILH